jgi:hypothetical protein
MKTYPARCGMIWQGSWSSSVFHFQEYVSMDKEDGTVEIMVDAVIMESVSPHSEEDDEPELEHVLTEEAVRCVKTLKIYIGKMENGQKTFSK